LWQSNGAGRQEQARKKLETEQINRKVGPEGAEKSNRPHPVNHSKTGYSTDSLGGPENMSRENKVTTTIFLTLLFGGFFSALVNGITDSHGVHWPQVLCHFEFYALLLLGFIITFLAKSAAREDSEQQASIKEKLDAIQAQILPVELTPPTAGPAVTTPLQTQLRDVVFTPEAKKSLERQEDRVERKVMKFLVWLQTASLSDIAMNQNIRKRHSESATDFVIRIGNVRILVDLKLRDGKIFVIGLLEDTGGDAHKIIS
jgi:hypothetical protein